MHLCQCRAGLYVGKLDDDGLPRSRESAEYLRDHVAAVCALTAGKWAQASFQRTSFGDR